MELPGEARCDVTQFNCIWKMPPQTPRERNFMTKVREREELSKISEGTIVQTEQLRNTESLEFISH